MAEDAVEDGVLLELGRLVWAAIKLEDVVYPVCRSIKPRHGLYDDFPIGPRIDEARGDLRLRPDDELRFRADAWLVEAKAALEVRNSLLHAVPVRFEPWPGSEPVPPSARGTWLSHFPRNKGQDPVHTQMSVGALRPIRRRVEAARPGWEELAPALWASRPDRRTEE